MLKSAAETMPRDEVVWQELVLAASGMGQREQACEFCKQAIKHHPRSGWLWRQLGGQLIALGRLDEAAKALNNSRTLEPDAPWLWRYFAQLHQKRKDYQAAIEAWESLFELDEPDGNDLNSLGIAYHNHGNFAKAVECYRLSAITAPDPAPFFNMGLVFNHPEVSQDADAADAYRRALKINPDHERGRTNLETTKQKLVPLAARARQAAVGLIQKHEHFQFYLSPFEAFQIDSLDDVDALDVRTIQRAKKLLLQEIELNDGKIGWLDDHLLDKSRALILEDELLDETKRRFHWAVFENEPLLRFLTRGEIEHFLYSDDYFPQQTLELLDEEPEFRDFLSKPFAKQYSLLLTRAIERRALPVVEVLFDGRRWVTPEDEDTCFAGAYKRVGDLVERLRNKVSEGEERKVTVGEMEKFLSQHSIPELFNLLPTAFRAAQSDAVAQIRSLAVACYNEHGDADLSRGILNLCKRFQFKSVELNRRLDEDFKTIEQKIAEERKAEVRLQFGAERPFEITKEGIRDGKKFIPASAVRDLRWGITVTGYTGAERFEYLVFARADNGDSVTASWTTDKAGEDRQTEFFSQMVNACINYLALSAIEKIQQRLNAGNSVAIGSCVISRQGVAFQTQGIIFKKHRFLPWRDVATEIRNGQVVVFSKSQQGISTAVPMRETDNAVLLPIIRSFMETMAKEPPPLPGVPPRIR